MLRAGDHVGRYEIKAVVGEGGFGQVYRAWDPELERSVAIKELSIQRQAHDPARHAEYRERFKLERQIQGRFQHPHIVSVYDLVQQDGDEYLVEEFVDGGTLRDLLQPEGRLSPERVVEIGLELCRAIAAAWEQDIVHRDIKPSNILLTGDGHAKLTDFGVAQIGQMSQRTQADSHHPGTPAYMSPEQERGGGYLDERSDLYALGLVLYEALTGKSYKRERVPVRQLTPSVPRRLEKVVMQALAPDPAGRYQHAAELEVALRQAVGKPRPAAWGWIGGGLLLVLLVAGWIALSQVWQGDLPAPTATWTVTPAPSETPLPLTPIPTLSPTAGATVVPTATPTITASPSVTPGVKPVISAPRLAGPPGASLTTSAQVTVRWEGELPDASYGFRVSLRHVEGAPAYTSPILDGTHWTTNLPGGAVGEWHWSVAVVRRSGTQDVVARSDEWTFYYNPFPSPFTSPLMSPLSAPRP